MNDYGWWWPNDIRGPWRPKTTWQLSYRCGKTPKKPHPRNSSRPGIEPRPPAWQARLQPSGHSGDVQVYRVIKNLCNKLWGLIELTISNIFCYTTYSMSFDASSRSYHWFLLIYFYLFARAYINVMRLCAPLFVCRHVCKNREGCLRYICLRLTFNENTWQYLFLALFCVESVQCDNQLKQSWTETTGRNG